MDTCHDIADRSMEPPAPKTIKVEVYALATSGAAFLMKLIRSYEICRSIPGIDRVIRLQAKQKGQRVYVDAILGCGEGTSFHECCRIADSLRQQLLRAICHMKSVVILVAPMR